MSQNLKNFAKFQKLQLDNLIDFEKCCKTHIYLQKSVPIQPKTSNNLPKKVATSWQNPVSCRARRRFAEAPPGVGRRRGLPPGTRGGYTVDFRGESPGRIHGARFG